MGTTIKTNKLPARPVILCTWYDNDDWHTYENLCYQTDLEKAFEETCKTVVWSNHQTFEMEFVGYRSIIDQTTTLKPDEAV